MSGQEMSISPSKRRGTGSQPVAGLGSPVLHGLKAGCKRSAADSAGVPQMNLTTSKQLKRQMSTEEFVTPLSRRRGVLVLEDGSRWPGYSFGADNSISGEVVFNTSMVGYPEALTDPSYRGQVLTLTFPLIGNYGVPPNTKDDLGLPIYFESEKVHITVSRSGIRPPHPSARALLRLPHRHPRRYGMLSVRRPSAHRRSSALTTRRSLATGTRCSRSPRGSRITR